jgi:conjugative transfer pilus assembly protein TraH
MRGFKGVCENDGLLLQDKPKQTSRQRNKLLQKLRQIVPYIKQKNINILHQMIGQIIQLSGKSTHLCKKMVNIKAILFWQQYLDKYNSLKQTERQAIRQTQYLSFLFHPLHAFSYYHYLSPTIKHLILFASFFFLLPTTSQAGSVEQGMRDFLFSNSNTNYSSGGAYKSQRRGYYATPSVYVRNSVVDVRPISMAMPTFRGGCGGIDMFAGSFSHINADQFIALMKAIPSNALGYGFQLALETISPSIADTMNKMESIMRDINNANLNSCELGKSIVNTGLSRFDAGTEMLCVRRQMESGRASDIAQAKKNCTSGGERSSTLSSNDIPQDERIVDINYAWNAVSKLGVDKEMKEFLQTITGTIIVQNSGSDNTGSVVKIYPSLATDTTTIKALLYGGSMKRYVCDESIKCLNVNDGGSVTIPQTIAFHNKVNDVIKSISSKMMVRNQELSQEENDIVSTTSLPIIAILRTYQKYYAGEIDSMISDSLSEIVAHDLLTQYMENFLKQVKTISKQNTLQVDDSKLKQFQDGIETAMDSLRVLEYKYQKKREVLLREQRNAETVEKFAGEVLRSELF